MKFTIKPLHDTTIKRYVAGVAALAATALACGAVAADDPAGNAAPQRHDVPSRGQQAGGGPVGAWLRHSSVDPSLSGSGKVACSSCHDPAHAFGPANALPVQMGGGDLRQPGLRAVPSLTYLQAVPSFTEHFFEFGGRCRREHRQWPDRRPDLGRARRPWRATRR